MTFGAEISPIPTPAPSTKVTTFWIMLLSVGALAITYIVLQDKRGY